MKSPPDAERGPVAGASPEGLNHSTEPATDDTASHRHDAATCATCGGGRRDRLADSWLVWGAAYRAGWSTIHLIAGSGVSQEAAHAVLVGRRKTQAEIRETLSIGNYTERPEPPPSAGSAVGRSVEIPVAHPELAADALLEAMGPVFCGQLAHHLEAVTS